MASPDLLQRRLLFVTGKGGVGKSSVAAGLALLAAERGLRTLLCQVDPAGQLADLLEAGELVFAPREIQPGLFVMSMDTEASLREFLSLQLRLPLVTKLGPVARAFDFVANAAPGVREVLTVGKLAWEVRENRYDLVVVDSVASGHIVGQLASAKGINDLVSVGALRSQTAWMLDILGDPAMTGAVIVATPEEMPVNETVELAARLEAETNVDLAAVIVNRVLPELFGRAEEAVFDLLCEEPARGALASAAGGDPSPLLDGAALAVRLRRTRAGHLDSLRSRIGAVPMLYVPEMFSRSVGPRFARQMAAALEDELS